MTASTLVSFLILIAVAWLSLMYLNTGESGYLKGNVVDSNGAPVWGAYIVVNDQKTGLNITSSFIQVLDNTASFHQNFSQGSNLTFSDLSGYYEIKIPKSGTYSIIAVVANPINSTNNFVLVNQTSVYLQTDRNRTLDLVLKTPN